MTYSNENIKSVIDASKHTGPPINIEETKYMLLSRHQNVGQSRDLKIANRYFQNMAHINISERKYQTKISFRRK
jgi:hypothetical protein